MPNVAPINVTQTQAESGFGTVPPGWYALKVAKCSDVKPIKSGEYNRRIYLTEIVCGPGQDQTLKGRKFRDPIPETDQWAGRHMELYAACMGSPDAVRQAALQNGGNFDLDKHLVGKTYFGLVTESGNFNNVVRRVPYTTDNWNLILAGEDPDPIEEGAQPQVQQAQSAPLPGGAMVAAPAVPMGPPPSPPAGSAPAAGGPPLPPSSVPLPG
uniref:Uncharacterized protein n=1 Tax=viral metagenome TaxID=1070528 RepID=A0A6H1Z7L0_9ZZZZ